MAQKTPQYTYDDFWDAYQKSGVNFSDADLKMAQIDPNYGMATISNKLEYARAGSDEARALWHQKQEDLRSSVGGYTGGIDGSMYIMNNLSPINYTEPEKPTYSGSAYSNDLQNLWNQQMNYGSFSFNEAQPVYNGSSYQNDINNLWQQTKDYGGFTFDEVQPTYTNRYDDRIQAKLSTVENPAAFTYDAATDPLYQQYRKQYAREGQRATADALAAAAAASGGIPSSYAQTAAGQQANYYSAQMTDKIPELYQLAYQKYLNDYQMEQTGLAALQNAEANDYNKYRTELNQYNANRDFARAIWGDEYNMLQGKLSSAQALDNAEYNKYLGELGQYNINRDFARNIWNDEYNHLANNVNTAQSLSNQEYQQYLDALNQYNIDRNFGYGQYLDELNSQAQERADKQTYAQLAASMGDYSYMNKLGIDTSNNPVDYERQYNQAVLAAQYGDYSGLAALGINPNLGNVNDAALAGNGKYYGSGGYYSGGSGGSGGSSYSGGGGSDYGTGVNNEDLSDSEVRALQRKLQDLGLYNGEIDGLIGPQTRAALQGYSARDVFNSYVGSQALNDGGEFLTKERPLTEKEIFNAQLAQHEMDKVSNAHSDQGVYVEGAGVLTWERLSALEKQGKIKKNKNSDGTYTYIYVG